MDKKKLLIIALVIGAFAAFAVWASHKKSEEKYNKMMEDRVEVVMAATDIKSGTPLDEETVTTEKVPRQFLPPNPVLKEDFEEVYAGTPVSRDVAEGDMILASYFEVAETSGALSGRVPPGERAMSIAVDEISGVSGLLQPGDRVDILGTFPVSDEDEVVPEAGQGEGGTGYVTMTLLQNVTLLGVGQQISGGDLDGQTNTRGQRNYNTVTASVTIDEAELLTIAQTRGDLTLLLRHSEDVEMGSVDKKTLREVLEDLEVLNDEREERIEDEPKPKPKKDDDIEIIRGN
ncbi:MAG: Flp pilus assembly protein CpaB [Persicimonas sp.]